MARFRIGSGRINAVRVSIAVASLIAIAYALVLLRWTLMSPVTARLFDWLVSGDPSATIAAVGTFIAALAAIIVALRRQSHREHRDEGAETRKEILYVQRQLNGEGYISAILGNIARDQDRHGRNIEKIMERLDIER